MPTMASFYTGNCLILISLYTLRNSLKTTLELKKKLRKRYTRVVLERNMSFFFICINILRKISFVDPCFEIQQIELNCFKFF